MPETFFLLSSFYSFALHVWLDLLPWHSGRHQNSCASWRLRVVKGGSGWGHVRACWHRNIRLSVARRTFLVLSCEVVSRVPSVFSPLASLLYLLYFLMSLPSDLLCYLFFVLSSLVCHLSSLLSLLSSVVCLTSSILAVLSSLSSLLSVLYALFFCDVFSLIHTHFSLLSSLVLCLSCFFSTLFSSLSIFSSHLSSACCVLFLPSVVFSL